MFSVFFFLSPLVCCLLEGFFTLTAILQFDLFSCHSYKATKTK